MSTAGSPNANVVVPNQTTTTTSSCNPCHKLNAGNLWQSDTQIQYCNYKEKAKEVTFIWTDAEIELLLEAVKVFVATCLFELGKE